jgi:hypothetical protein
MKNDFPKGIPQHPSLLGRQTRRGEAVTRSFASFGKPKEGFGSLAKEQ